MRSTTSAGCLVLLVAACSPAKPPTTDFPPAAFSTDPPAPADPATCRIEGPGGLDLVEPYSAPAFVTFSVYATAESTTPVFVVGAPSKVHVSWTIGPETPTNGAPRARVRLGGQSLLRYDGWASPLERFFQLRKTYPFGNNEHVWLRVGKEVDVLHAWPSGTVRVRARSDDREDVFYPDVPCADLAYEPTRLSANDGPKEGSRVVGPLGLVELLDAPAGKLQFRFFELASATVLDQRDGFTRIGGEHHRMAFDGWVRDAELATKSARRRPSRAAPRVEPPTAGAIARVKADTQLYVGDEKIDGAFVEAGARVVVLGQSGGRASFAFAALDDAPPIRAPEGRELSIDAAALEPVAR